MAFLDKLKSGLAKTKNALFGQIEDIVKAFVKVDEDLLEELEETLICADVGVGTAEEIIEKLREQIKDGRLKEQDQVMDALKGILREMIGEGEPLKLDTQPSVVLVIGVNGAGKTTSIGKISNILRNSGKKVVVAAADTFRAAAIDQLAVWCERSGVEIVKQNEGSDPAAVVYDAANYAKSHKADVLIVDTAGRLAVDEAMMQEITAIKAAVKPSETLFVVDSMTGQDAVNTAKEFNDRLDFDGVVLTKLDGDTRGGAAISIRSVVNKPMKFISSGEKMDSLQVFHPERMADRILGMGDVVSLVERAQEQYDEEAARKLKKKLVKDQFNFNDFIDQINQIKKMGNLKDIASMIPGMGKMLKDVDIPDDAFKQTEAIISSMTPAEREKPEIINAKRRERIAKGSGTTMADVNRLMKQFEETRKMMKMVAGGGMKMPRMGRGGFRR